MLKNFSIKTGLVGTQKNHLNETILWSTQYMLELMGKKFFTILPSKIVLI